MFRSIVTFLSTNMPRVGLPLEKMVKPVHSNGRGESQILLATDFNISVFADRLLCSIRTGSMFLQLSSGLSTLSMITLIKHDFENYLKEYCWYMF